MSRLGIRRARGVDAAPDGERVSADAGLGLGLGLDAGGRGNGGGGVAAAAVWRGAGFAAGGIFVARAVGRVAGFAASRALHQRAPSTKSVMSPADTSAQIGTTANKRR